jgi:hypothetical protein
MTKKDILFKIAFYVVLAILFIACATIVILFATGYKVDIKNREITQTGIIVVKTLDKNCDIYVDGKVVDKEKTVIRNLDPGFYTVAIKRSKYQTFEDEFYLDPGEAKIIDNVVLFLEQPKLEDFSESDNVLFEKLSDTNGLAASDRELFLNDQFLTRFKSKIQDVCWYPNDRFLGITTDNQFKIIDINTLHEFPLFEKKSSRPVIFIDSGKTVLFESDGKIFSAQ